MKVTLPEFERAGVLVVGDVMLDRYWYGPTSRISPEAPVPVVKVENIEERPGGAANVAMNIASLGATSRLVGLTGIDDAARALSQALANVNVKCDFVSVPTHPTITKLRVLSRNQQLIRLDFEEGFSGVDPQPMHERISPGRRTMTSSFSMTSIMDGLCTAVPLRSRYPLLPVTSTAESSKTAPSILNK